jgi:hypothetical protein
MKRIIFALLIGLVLVACEQVTEPIKPESNCDLVGRWSVGGHLRSGKLTLSQIDTVLFGILEIDETTFRIDGYDSDRGIILYSPVSETIGSIRWTFQLSRKYNELNLFLDGIAEHRCLSQPGDYELLEQFHVQLFRADS